MRKRKLESLTPDRSSGKKGRLPKEISDSRDLRPAISSPADAQAQGQREIIGSLEAIVEETAEGWAMNVQTPTKPVTVEFFF